jgi:hypothetical protein
MAENSTAQEREIILPQEIVESFARFLVPEIRKYYDSERGQREFAEWEKTHGGDTKAVKKPKGDKMPKKVNAAE